MQVGRAGRFGEDGPGKRGKRRGRSWVSAQLYYLFIFLFLQILFNRILKRRKEGETQNKIRVCVFLKVK